MSALPVLLTVSINNQRSLGQSTSLANRLTRSLSLARYDRDRLVQILDRLTVHPTTSIPPWLAIHQFDHLSPRHQCTSTGCDRPFSSILHIITRVQHTSSLAARMLSSTCTRWDLPNLTLITPSSDIQTTSARSIPHLRGRSSPAPGTSAIIYISCFHLSLSVL
jgi:hypothetical protein